MASRSITPKLSSDDYPETEVEEEEEEDLLRLLDVPDIPIAFALQGERSTSSYNFHKC